MIKVNLLNGIASAPGAAVATAAAPALDMAVQKRALARIGVIILAIGAVYIYNMTVVQADQAKLAQINQSTKKIQDETNGYGPTAPIVEKYNAEKAKTEKELGIMSGLAQNRLREVKALDQIQSLVGNDTWLTSIHIKEGRMEMQGQSKTSQGESDLIRSLSSSMFFTNLQVKSATQEDVSSGQMNKFDLECQIGANP